MVATTKTFECFIGAWGFLNVTLAKARNTTTGEALPQWHSVYPSGISSYAPSGYVSWVITANDTTEPDKRPRNVTVPAQPTDDDATWATVAKYSLASGGPFEVLNATDALGNATTYTNRTSDGPSGWEHVYFTISTLSAWVGASLDNESAFYDDCNVHVLKTRFDDALQTVSYYRLPDNSPS